MFNDCIRMDLNLKFIFEGMASIAQNEITRAKNTKTELV